MKLPRDVSGDRLIRALQHLGYEAVRQRGSHVRLRHEGPPLHLITVPVHNPLKTGTLHGILSEVAHMRSVSIETLMELL
jgi:predicted RNA binding protein YcfA (HicA-like mRNA interferase family)